MAQDLPQVVQELVDVLPAAMVHEVSCYAFYDHHPRDNKKIDMIICSNNGELKEVYQRELVASTALPLNSEPKEILVLRSYDCELFYLVASQDEVVLVSRKRDVLVAYKKISNVERYELYDSSCRGQACLKVICNDDAVPHIFDENFVSMADKVSIMSGVSAVDSIPVMTQLRRKLNEAKYSVMQNEVSLKEFTSLRQVTAFTVNQRRVPRVSDVMSHINVEEPGVLLLKSNEPWVKLCNRFLVIVFYIKNTSNKPLQDIQILLHGNTNTSIVYKHRLFDRLPSSPFWKEKDIYIIPPESETTLAVVIDIKEFTSQMMSKIEIRGVICYREKDGNDHVLPFNEICVPAAERMALMFDVLANIAIDVPHTVLAVLATTESKDFCIRHINVNSEEQMELSELFVKYLDMDQIVTNVFVHRTAPYHTLHGIMVIVHNQGYDKITASVHARSKSQLMSLLHFINDQVPLTLVVTTTNIYISSKFPTALSNYTENAPARIEKQIDLKKYCESIEKQIASVISYADNCLIRMSESKDPAVQLKVGTSVDLFMAGSDAYLAFRKQLLNEAVNGISFSTTDNSSGSKFKI